jgi:Fe-Mn family superoxide dismutase
MTTHHTATTPACPPDRREFLGLTTAGVGLMALGQLAYPSLTHAAISSTPVTETLSPLPWADTSLEPVISANTLSFHYGKHHQTYLTNLRNLLAANTGLGLDGQSLEAIIRLTAGKKDSVLLGIYRNAAQVYNHDFYWKSLSPTGGGEPTGAIAAGITRAFGDYATFRTRLIDAAVAQFGTGWAWVVADRRKKISILATNDADTPLTLKPALTPLLTIDVWEHAYYLDYQNGRKTYVTAVVDKLLNWEFANQNLAA